MSHVANYNFFDATAVFISAIEHIIIILIRSEEEQNKTKKKEAF